MTETFTASNGITVFVRDGGTVQFQHGTRAESCGILQIMPHSEWWQTLREFFQYERDESLGRWRSPENPEHVVYAKRGSDPAAMMPSVRVITESTGRSRDIERSVLGACEPTVSVFGKAARAYFEAHPERKPWQEAKPGEVWVLSTSDGHEDAFMVMAVGELGIVFEADQFREPLDSPDITGGRRIWPEDAS